MFITGISIFGILVYITVPCRKGDPLPQENNQNHKSMEEVSFCSFFFFEPGLGQLLRFRMLSEKLTVMKLLHLILAEVMYSGASILCSWNIIWPTQTCKFLRSTNYILDSLLILTVSVHLKLKWKVNHLLHSSFVYFSRSCNNLKDLQKSHRITIQKPIRSYLVVLKYWLFYYANFCYSKK